MPLKMSEPLDPLSSFLINGTITVLQGRLWHKIIHEDFMLRNEEAKPNQTKSCVNTGNVRCSRTNYNLRETNIFHRKDSVHF